VKAAPPPDAARRLLKHAARALAPPSLLVTRGAPSRRAVALTIDDGPDDLIGDYLDVLDRFDARATFFVLGKQCAARRSELLEMVRRGHEVASHGYSHKRFPTLSAAELDDELRTTAALLPVPLTRRPLVRPPQGATSLRSLFGTALRGYTTVLWSLDSDDCRTQSADEVAAKVAPERVTPGEIVLLHEAQAWTLEALPRICDGLKQAGYELITVGELLRR
jgi:peptidoglycan/xylan/chitin deacetylase (PgdA/CDA1 family)